MLWRRLRNFCAESRLYTGSAATGPLIRVEPVAAPRRLHLESELVMATAARPRRAGAPSAEPGGGRASGAACGAALDQIRLDSATLKSI